MAGLLNSITGPEDLKRLSLDQLKELSADMRHLLQETVFQTGGHFASNLGTVELSIALHYVFNSPVDKLVWDVGHQAYPHKLLTGRVDRFSTIRQYDGLCGFLERSESVHDSFGAGHASTSISAGLGMAVARDLKGENFSVVSIIGDGALTGGMALEALNNAGSLKTPFIVVLNDNEMSISKNVGALSKYLDRVRADKMYLRAKDEFEHAMGKLPLGGEMLSLAKRVKKSVKDMVLPSTIWEELGFIGLGPVDGHDIAQLIETFQLAKEAKLPVFIHAITVKGKGYAEAEVSVEGRIGYHARPNKLNPGVAPKGPKYEDVFGNTLIKLAETDKKILAITAAMRSGTGLDKFSQVYPERFFDVGIAEQHAVTFAAGLATEGFKPVAAIYSTFLQRAYDQVLHDVCLQNLQVIFAMDRAGIVGDDGKTHQGMFDISYLRCIPNIVLMAPKDENELQHMLYTATQHRGPIGLRYPRGASYGVEMDKEFKALPIGKGEILREGEDLALVALGSEVYPAMEAAEMLAERGIRAAVINARFIKPLDEELLLETARKYRRVVTVEEAALAGGFGSAVMELFEMRGLNEVEVHRVGVRDHFVTHGAQSLMREKEGLDPASIASQVEAWFPELALVRKSATSSRG
ncbi:MAG: 1-deoxy-D-xylulose-5-phosphate synthase [Chloroflexi bacterium]|nr:1-deoxy-D-xylulose-5-phosphate synthase [Chloroflexota bacterium]OJW06504.1 MAG: 1-deoxy-D-xylulose-5-phosphate synthase [Chloroflexi bacterium 54-19]